LISVQSAVRWPVQRLVRFAPAPRTGEPVCGDPSEFTARLEAALECVSAPLPPPPLDCMHDL
jgi:hypothetical protein